MNGDLSPALRADRLRRLLDAMAADDLDALVLGRAADVAFAAGARQLWTAGARPFGPGCIVVRATGRVHVLSVWDEGMPPEISHDALYGISWNPANLIASLAAIPGLKTARRVGTGSSSPGFPSLFHAVAPDASIVDGGPAIWAARRLKSDEELRNIAEATAVAEAAMSAMVGALRPGVTERDLVGAHLERIAALGVPTPPTEGVACATATAGPVTLRRIATDRPIVAGQLVVLDAGGFMHGYLGGVGRTWVAGDAAPSRAQRAISDRCRHALEAVIERCRDGVTGAEICAAWCSTGEPLTSEPIVHGVGLGVEPPVIGHGVGANSVLTAGMVVSVSAWVYEEGVGGFFERETVALTRGAPRVISCYGRGPAADTHSFKEP